MRGQKWPVNPGTLIIDYKKTQGCNYSATRQNNPATLSSSIDFLNNYSILTIPIRLELVWWIRMSLPFVTHIRRLIPTPDGMAQL